MKKILTPLIFTFLSLILSLTAIPTVFAEDSVNIDISAVSSDGTGYTYSGNIITITTNGSYTITGTSTSKRMKVASGVTADITLSSVGIDVSSSSACAFDMTGATVDLTLIGDNTLKSGQYYAGLYVPQGALTVTAASTGTLRATGGDGGTGIGSEVSETTGSIAINGGTIIATGTRAAGIGGGYSSNVSSITISGGDVTATGGEYGAGIGSGGYKACGTILITGGTIHAYGGSDAPGIGCGFNGNGGTITINGGDIHAKGGSGGMGIGTQYGTVSVSIGGGTVEAVGGDYSPGIGGGGHMNFSTGEITIGSVYISSGNITATGGSYSAGIGGSYGGYICNITIDGGTILATGNTDGAGIGGGADCTRKGSIIINGGNITAKGGHAAAGIGAGGGKDEGYSRCGDITITGGEVTAQGGLYAAGIGGGGGNYASECGTITITGANTIVNATGDTALGVSDIGSGWKFTYMTTINSGTLIVDGGATVNYNQGGSNSSKRYVTCIIGGTGAGSETGIYYYGQKVNGVIDISDPGTGKLCGTGYSYSANTVSIGTSGTYAVINTTATNRLAVAGGVTANVTMRDVSIDVSGISGACAFDTTGATVNLTLVGDNTLKSGSGCAGLQVPDGAALTILSTSTGTLNVTGGENGAGIGGGSGSSGGTITMNGGEITATGGQNGAGIGGGSGGSCNSVIVSSQVMAYGGANGAGVGGGSGGSGGTVEVIGSDSIMVSAIGGTESDGYDVGSGYGNTSGGSLTVNGGTILGLMRNGTNAATSYITCGIGGPGAGLNRGTYLNSKKLLSVNRFVTDHPDGANALDTVQIGMLVDGLSSTLPEGEIVFKSDGIEIGRASIMHMEELEDDQGGAIISWTAQGGTHTLTAQYVQNETADSYYMTGTGEIADYDVAKIEQAPLSVSGIPDTVTYGDPFFTLSVTGGSGTGTGLDFSVTGGEAVSVDSDGTVTVEKAGTAEITVTKEGDTNYNSVSAVVPVTVNKAAPPEVVFPSAGTLTYGQTLSDSALTGGSGDGTFAWADSSTVPTVKNSGYPVVFTPNDTDNYDYTGFVFTQNVSIQVNKAVPVVTFPTAAEITYEQPLSDSALTGGSGDGTFAWESPTTIPTVVNSGYRVLFTPNDADNFESVSQIVPISVQKAGQAALTVDGVPGTVTYGDASFTLSVTGGSGTGTGLSFSVTSGEAVSVDSDGLVTVEKAGTAEITVTKAGDTNYLPVSTVVAVTVNKAAHPAVVFPSAGALTYGQTLSHSALTGGAGDGTFAWANSSTVPTVKNSGYPVVFTPNDTDNYDYTDFVFTQNVSLFVAKALPVVTFPTAEEITYEQTLSDSALTGGSGDGAFAWESPAMIPTVVNSGYSVVFTPGDTDNYLTVSQIVDLSVQKAEQTSLTISGVSGPVTYGDAPFALGVGGGSGTGTDLSFSVPDGEAVSVDSNGTVTVEKAGTAEVTVTKEGDTNYNSVSAVVTITVNKATPPAVVFPSAGALTYGQTLSDSALTGGSGDGTFAWEDSSTVPIVKNGGYSVVFTPNDTDNYDYTGFVFTQNVSIQVNKAAPVVTFPTAEEITYEQPLSASALTGGSGDGTFAWESPTTIPTVVNSGYSVVFTPNDADNFESVSQVVPISVQKAKQAELTVDGIPGTVTYGDSSFDLSVTGGSGIGTSLGFSVTGGEAVSVSTSGTVTVLKAGTAEITVTKAGDTNYNSASAVVTVTVNKATPPAVVFPSAGALTYGQTLSDSALTGGSGDGAFAWADSSTVPTVKNSGYPVVFTPNDTDNFDYTDVVLTQKVGIFVAKAAPVVTFPTADEITYGQTLSDSALTGGSGDGTFAWESPTTIPTVVNSGYRVLFTPNDADNFESVSQTVMIPVQKAEQAPLSSSGVPDTVTYGDASFALGVGGGSGTGAISYRIASGDAVSVDQAGVVTVIRPGKAIIAVTKAADSNNLSTEKQVEICVEKADQRSLTISGVPQTILSGDASFGLVVNGGSGTGAFSYAVSSGNAVSVGSNGVVTILKPGTAVIAVTKAADDDYNTATATVEISVGEAPSAEKKTPAASSASSAATSDAAGPTSAETGHQTTADTSSTTADSSSTATDSSAAVTLNPLSIQTDAETGVISVTIRTADLPEGTSAIKLPSGKIVQIPASSDAFQIQVSQEDLSEDGTVVLQILDDESVPLGNYLVDLSAEAGQDGTVKNASSPILILCITGVVLVGGASAAAVFLRKKR